MIDPESHKLTAYQWPRGFPRPRRRTPVGAAPGTLIQDPNAAAPVIRLIAYGPDELEEHEVGSVADLKPLLGVRPVQWINIDGLADLQLIRDFGELFNLHHLALEDVVNVHQRPKVEEYEDHAFIVTRIIHPAAPVAGEQVSMFLGKGFLLTFQEKSGDCFDPVRERIRKRRGQICERAADYLAYALLDAMIDGYFPVLEEYGERLEDVESRLMSAATEHQVKEIHALKRDLLTLRRTIWPQREMVSVLARESTPYISDKTRVYLRDCYDHTIQLLDLLEMYRDIASGLIDIYLSSISARMNEIMKVLTIIATIFIPLGFIASLYGMNFDRRSPLNMPELGWRFGYPFALTLMVVTAGFLLWYFYRKRWIRSGSTTGSDDPGLDRPAD